MANITNGTLCPRSDTVSVLHCARALKEFLETKHPYSILDESRNHTGFALLLSFIKFSVLSHGISNIVSLGAEISNIVSLGAEISLFVPTLLNCILIFMARNYILNFTVFWTFFAALLCYMSSNILLPTFARFVFLVTILCLAPIHHGVPSTLDYIVDVLFVAHVGIYILRTFLGPIDEIIKDIFLVATFMVLFLAFGLASDAKRPNFMLTSMFFLLSPLTFQAFMHRKLPLFLLVAFIQSYCVYEQFFIYRTLSENTTYEQSANTTYHEQ